MRSLAWLSLLLVVVAPSVAWSGALTTTTHAVPGQPTEAPQVDPATLCETAITTAEFVHRLPPRLLAAISLTETGRLDPAMGRIRPWPWTLNAEGEGHFFETRQDAVAAVKSLQARGVRSIDVGCLQVNLMYHASAFASLYEAFDPRGNANYAAGFLNSLYAEGKDWSHAIGAYHSETMALGDAYRVLVMARWQNSDLRPLAPAHAAYQDFAISPSIKNDQVYGAFAPRSVTYRAFAPR